MRFNSVELPGGTVRLRHECLFSTVVVNLSHLLYLNQYLLLISSMFRLIAEHSFQLFLAGDLYNSFFFAVVAMPIDRRLLLCFIRFQKRPDSLHNVCYFLAVCQLLQVMILPTVYCYDSNVFAYSIIDSLALLWEFSGGAVGA